MSRLLMAPVNSSRRSARVDLPWSMWAMMQKFRIRSRGVWGTGVMVGCRARTTVGSGRPGGGVEVFRFSRLVAVVALGAILALACGGNATPTTSHKTFKGNQKVG